MPSLNSTILVTEDGTGLADANSFITLQEAEFFGTSRGRLSFLSLTLTMAQKRNALVVATDYVDVIYGPEWSGTKTVPESALTFPRTGLVTSTGRTIGNNEVPEDIKVAVAILALEYLENDLIDLFLGGNPDDISAGGALVHKDNILETYEKIGPAVTQIKYGDGSHLTGIDGRIRSSLHPEVHKILLRFVKSSSLGDGLSMTYAVR